MTRQKSHNHDELETFFQAAKDAQTEPGVGLMDKILQDAAIVQASFTDIAPVPPVGLWAGFLEALGGWRGVSALTACACVSLWVGFSAPDTINNLSAGLVSTGDLAELDYGDLYGLQDLLTEI